MKGNCVGPFCSTGIRHHEKMVYHQHKTVWPPIQDTLPAYHSSFALEWQHSDQVCSNTTDRGYTGRKSKVLQHRSKSLPEIQVGTNVAVQDHKTRLQDTYSVEIAIGPQYQYHVKTQKGSVLVHNQCFISAEFQNQFLTYSVMHGALGTQNQ